MVHFEVTFLPERPSCTMKAVVLVVATLAALVVGETKFDFTADVIISNDPKIVGSLSGTFHYQVITPVTDTSDKRMRIDYNFGSVANPPQQGPYEIYDEIKVRNNFDQ